MSEEERRERHRQNYMHVATHTAQVHMQFVCVREGREIKMRGLASTSSHWRTLEHLALSCCCCICCCFGTALFHTHPDVG